MSNMGLLLQAQGRLAEAETYYRKALKGFRRVLGDEHPTTIYRMSNLGTVLRDQGQLSEAEELFAEGLRRARGALLGDSLIGSFLMNHARTLAAMERFEQAEAELVEVQELYAAAQRPADAGIVATMRSFAEL